MCYFEDRSVKFTHQGVQNEKQEAQWLWATSLTRGTIRMIKFSSTES